MTNKLHTISSTSITDVLSEKWSGWRIARKLAILGIPLIVGELGSVVQQYADTIMVGHYGTDHLAAAGFVNTIFLFVIFLTLGMSYAVTPLVGNAYGRKDFKSVCRIFREGIRTNLIVGLLFVSALLLLYFNLERLFFTPGRLHHQQPSEILTLSKGYFLILTASVPFLTVFYACKQYLDGIGKTGMPMLILLVSNLLNIGLNWCFIFGHCGFEASGVYGAGIATLISRAVQMIWIINSVRRSAIVKENYRTAEPSWNGVWRQIKLGFPISLQLGLEIGMFNVCGIFAGWLSAPALAAHQAMYTISTTFFQVLYGVGAAGTILISQFRSANAWSNVRRTARVAFRMGLVFIVLTSLLVWTFFEPLASVFTNDEMVVGIMWCIMPSLLLYQLGDCLQITYANALRGLEHTKPLPIIAFFSYFVISIPICYFYTFKFITYMESNELAYLFDWWTPEIGLWLGIRLGLLTAGILFLVVFKRKLKSLMRS